MSRTGVLRSLSGLLRCFLTPLARSSPCDWSVCGRPCSATRRPSQARGNSSAIAFLAPPTPGLVPS